MEQTKTQIEIKKAYHNLIASGKRIEDKRNVAYTKKGKLKKGYYQLPDGRIVHHLLLFPTG